MNPPISSTNDTDETKEESSSRAFDAEDKNEANATEDDVSASANEENMKRGAEDPGCEARAEDKNRTPNDSVLKRDVNKDGSSAESSSSDEEEATNKSKEYFTDDGRQLSEYEIQRLERIKRNREYLAKLGLAGKDGGGVLGQKQRRKRSGKPNEVAVVRRSPISRRSKIKKVVTYAEPSASVRDLIRVADGKATDAPIDKRKPKKSVNERQEAFIYLEFKRIQSFKNQLAKQANRNVRLAEKEVKYWHKLVGRWERRNQKLLDAERQRQAEAKERVILGGKSIKELLQELDNRYPEIHAAVQRYDNDLQAQARKEYGDQLRAVAQEKVKMMDALDQFPKAMKNAVGLLNACFLEGAPMDLPPPRRSRRSGLDEGLETTTIPGKKVTARAERKPITKYDKRHDAADAAERYDGVECDNTKPFLKQRKRGRNVGGWISPEFSEVIDRSWLSGDAPTKEFELSNYVPQVGDTVLYYISGHKQFLAEYPDVLATKAKLKSRIPLWERAAQLRSGDAEATSAWWTERWLAGLESSGFGDFPLLCRVERTDVEFPPDPFSKVAKKDHEGSTKIYFKKPKNVTLDKAVSQLRIAVGLRPLTPLELPSPDTTASGPQPTALPPFFSVVTFPSNELDPFLVPFGWAYARAHSVTLNQKVQIRPGKDKTQFLIEEFMEHPSGRNQRLEENDEMIKKALHYFDNAPSRTVNLEELLKNGTMPLPLRDGSVVLDVWIRRFKGCLSEDEDSSSEMPPFADLIRRTLPLWKSVKLVRNIHDTHSTWVSPWQILAPGRERELSSPWRLGEQCYSLDEPLRARIESLLGEILSEYQPAAEMFFEPVTEGIAPSYFCAVPLGMSLSRISRRLQLNGPASNKACYYRSVDAVLADVASIVENCLLYNSPEAEVVREATTLSALIKDRIGKGASEYFQELNEARKPDEQRRPLCLQRSHSIGATVTVLDCLRKPFKEPLHREWLESTCRGSGLSLSSFRSVDTKDASAMTFCPQVGETVLYSLALHDRFVNGHFPSLEEDQCRLPSLDVIDDATPSIQGEAQPECSFSEWTKGEIIWTRPVFPKMPSKQNKDDGNTFSTMSTMLALGIKFQGSSVVSAVYWRPCLFHFDNGYAEGVCSGCGLASHESFLRAGSGIGDTCIVDNSLPIARRMSMCRCIDLLKRRCLKRTPPAFIDPQLTKENVKTGYIMPKAKVGKSSLPMFTQLFESCGPTPVVSHHGTRGASLKSPKENPEVDVLKDAGFIPIWVSSLAGGTSDDSLLQKAGTILPSPKLCLELIQLRLQNNYYRCPTAIENDLVEAYLCTVTLMLYGAATRKRSPVSVRRVAFALSSDIDVVDNNDTIEATVRDEEADWARRIRLVREVYAATLVSVSHTGHAEQVFGLADSIQLKPVFRKAEDPDCDRVAARKKIAFIMRAICRDECLNSFGGAEEWGMPTMKLTIRCGGEPFAYDSRYFSLQSTPLEAKIYDNKFAVTVRCGGEPTFFGNVSLFEKIASNVCKKKYVLAPPIFFGPDTYEKNDSLANLFFRRNGRANACARCQAYKRSMVTCRVARRHSNHDFDWLTWIPGGTNHINELLKALQSLNGDSVGDKDADSKTGEVNATIRDDRCETGEDDGQCNDDNDGDGDDGEDEGDFEEKMSMKVAETKFGDPRTFSNKAELALQLSKEVLADIATLLETSIRLSKEFIEKEFPVDEEDGHYLYCVICGLGGNLLCCDGCPIVVHPDCVGMADLPAGDWYCKDCKMNKSADIHEKESEKDSEYGTHTPYHALENASTKLDRVKSILDGLRSSRPTHQPKNKKTEDDDDDGDDDGAMTEDLSGKCRSKRLQPPSSLDDHLSDDEGERHYSKRRRRQTGQDFAISTASQQVTKTQRKEAAESSRNVIKIRHRKPKGTGNPFEILSETQKAFLLSIGIKTAEVFLAKRTTDIAPKFVVWRRKKGLPKLKGSGPTASVSAWKTSVRNAIEAMSLVSKDSGSDSETEEDEETTESSVIEIEGNDPLEALSATTKSFLESIGITTAVSFLSQRSTDIAPHFVEWRAKEGMSELKGSGPVASVSAWKTTVRTRAKEMGLHGVAELEPATQNRQPTTPQKMPATLPHTSVTAQRKPTQRPHAAAIAQTKTGKRKRPSATVPKIVAKRPLASATPPKTLAKRPQAPASPQRKPAKKNHASAASKPNPHVARSERQSQRNSVQRARRLLIRRSAVVSTKDKDLELEPEVSDSAEANGRRPRRKSRPPPRFIDIQESLIEGKASKTHKSARTMP